MSACPHQSQDITTGYCNDCGADLDREEIEAMTDEEIRWQLIAEGIDPDKSVARILAKARALLAAP